LKPVPCVMILWALASCMLAAPAFADEGAAGKIGCYISTGDNDWLWASPPTQSPAAVRAVFETLNKVFGCDRIYWRGMQSELIVDEYLLRPENFLLHEFWQWERHLAKDVGTSRAAVETAHDLGMTIWGYTALFDHGAQAVVGSAKGSGPSPIEDRVRVEHPEWVPVDRCGIRRQAGPVELAYAGARKALIRQYADAASRGGYDGLMFYTYVEHLALRFEDEYGYNDPIAEEFKKRFGRDIRTESFDKHAWYRLRGESVTEFLRELKAELKRRNIKLGVAIDPQQTHYPAPWLCVRGVRPTGLIYLHWERWIREGIVDEIMVYCNGSQESALHDVLAATQGTDCRVSVIHSLDFRPEHRHFEGAGVRRVIVGSYHWIEAGRREEQPPEALGGDDVYAKMRVLEQVAEGKTKVEPGKVLEAAKDPNILVRRQAIRALASCGGPAALAAVEAALDDPEHAVRCTAADVLSRVNGPQSVRKLLEAVRKHGNFQFKGVVRATLSRLGPEHAADILKGARDRDARVRGVAVYSLRSGQLRKEALPVLLDALSDPDDFVRFAAVESLCRFGGRPEVVEGLERALSDAHPTVRARAAVALGGMMRSHSRWPGPVQRRLLKKLAGIFGRFGADYKGADADWGFRPIGNAIVALGPRGREALEGFLRQRKDMRLADFAWRVLYVPQTGHTYCLTTEKEAARDYKLHPKFSEGGPVPKKPPEPERMPYLVQNFDGWKPLAAGEMGDHLHESGLWRTFDGVHPNPVIQDKIRHGEKGNAVRLRRCRPSDPHRLTGLRTDYRLRDERTSVDFRVYRADAGSSFVVFWRDSGVGGSNVAVFVRPGGKVAVMSRDKKWIDTDTVLEPGAWHRICLDVDPAKGCYSVRTGEHLDKVVREGVAVSPGLTYNMLEVSPQAPGGGVVYLDDVNVTVPNPAR